MSWTELKEGCPAPEFSREAWLRIDAENASLRVALDEALLQIQPQPEAHELTEFEIMRCIGEEFPIPLVDPTVLDKVYSVCRAVLAAAKGKP